MSTEPLDPVRHPDLAAALVALRRARKRAGREARMTHTKLVQVVNGKVVFVDPPAEEEEGNDPQRSSPFSIAIDGQAMW